LNESHLRLMLAHFSVRAVDFFPDSPFAQATPYCIVDYLLEEFQF